MAIFRYKLLTAAGQVESGVINLALASPLAVQDYFEQTGNTVLHVKPVTGLSRSWYQLMFALSYRKIKRLDVADFLRSLAVMTRSGVPLMSALDDAGEHLDNPAMSKVITEIKWSIESGSSLSAALEKHPQLFSDSVVHMIRMGEESGRLDATLTDAAENIRRISRIGVDVKKALLYPAFALAATLGALIFWLQFTVPSLANLYKMMQVDLPQSTRIVLAVSESLQQHLLYYVAGLVVSIFALRLLIRSNSQLRYYYDRLMLKVPLIGNLIMYSNMTFIFEYFSLMLKSGVDIYSALNVICGSMKNEVFHRELNSIKNGVAKGNSVSDELNRSSMFPRFVARMIKTGESSGSLTTQLNFIAEEYRDKLNDIIDNLKTAVEPLAILLIGGLMLVIIGALFFPIYKLIGTIGASGI